MEQNQLRGIFGQFASGVTVITCTNADGQPHGATVTAFTAISLETTAVPDHDDSQVQGVRLPRQRAVCGQHPCLRPSGHGHAFCRPTAAHRPRWIDGSTAPLLDGAVATISCVPWREYDGGDHIIFIGEIVDAQSSGKDPLLFYRSTFHDPGATSSTTVWNGSQDDPHSGWFDATTSFTPIHLQPAPQTI